MTESSKRISYAKTEGEAAVTVATQGQNIPNAKDAEGAIPNSGDLDDVGDVALSGSGTSSQKVHQVAVCSSPVEIIGKGKAD
ncbi:hypothetical protein RHMOL_Rhmol10G0227500 [Rhododendron molle]|uniref:Uncharacterized protein n=1 Tax=Rhododendron molle TaxID=49168 RepID=A0ACC0M685_RHOML|nr:hypothetical protein RHMOL_Rhmol10G0227500 [Rhododendron molle]